MEPRDAADASGVLITLVQLGNVVGVATLGTLFLDSISRPGPVSSGHALALTAFGVAALMAAAGVVATLRPRVRRA